jgi:hypothetical protein
MKGVELPINVLVIVVIAVIVLLAVVAVYFTGWTPYASSAEVETVKNDVCRQLVMGHSCNEDPDQIEITNFDADMSGTIDSNDDLQDLCDNYYGTLGDVDACKALCGCGEVTTVVGGGGPSPPTACSCDWVSTSGNSCPTIDCIIIGLGNGLFSRCVCNNPGCGSCVDSLGTNRPGDTGAIYCILCP